MSKIKVQLGDESGNAEVLLFDTETTELSTENGAEPTAQARNLACAIGLHAWYLGTCVNCGKVR